MVWWKWFRYIREETGLTGPNITVIKQITGQISNYKWTETAGKHNFGLNEITTFSGGSKKWSAKDP